MGAPDIFDCIIVGGGAAGIAAARRIAPSPYRGLLVEAGSRLGGRAWTETVDGMPLDLGCGWLHSAERNAWTRIAAASGAAIDRTPTAWGRQWRDLGFSRAEQDAAGAAFAAFDQRLRDTPPPDDRAAGAMPVDDTWRPFVDALSGYINGAALDRLSVADYLAYDDAASETNWRLPAGYGTLIASHAPRDGIALATPVTRIDGREPLLAIDTPRGTIRARTAIVTASTNVLAGGGIAFDPALDLALHAASELPLGLADKLFLAVDGADDLDPDSHLLGNPHRAETGSYYLRPFGRPVIEVFLGGAGAVTLEKAGLDGAAAFAIDELVALLGSGWRRRLRLVAGSRWGRSAHILGSYSHARPGCAGARAVLATPIDPRIAFAGEACSPADFSTAHGAHDSGVAAAEHVLAQLTTAPS